MTACLLQGEVLVVIRYFCTSQYLEPDAYCSRDSSLRLSGLANPEKKRADIKIIVR